MNKNQKLTLYITSGVMFIMLLFPPFSISLGKLTVNLNYGFIFDPPRYHGYNSSINILILLIQ